MHQIRPAHIVPLLVEQSTWGGEYIAKSKNLSHPLVQGKRIGQAFELYEGSWLSQGTPGNFAYATATALNIPTFADQTTAISNPPIKLQEWVDQDLIGVLGQKAADRGWKSMHVLIKFTQAQNNSYQVHVRPGQEFGKWLPKPESWYYLEKGKITLGLSDISLVEEYKQRCIEIDQYAQHLSQQVKAGTLAVSDARQHLKTFIDQDHPHRFVNTLEVEKDTIIDLSQGGIHHSWEMDPALPEGNIVYEVQVNVMDEFCTLRSFDQGNVKDDGAVRPLTIEDYFKALDIDVEHNKPQQLLQHPSSIQDGTTQISSLFNNQYYATELLTLQENYAGIYTTTQDSFHHVYALTNEVKVTTVEGSWQLPAGWSLFLPAMVEEYSLEPMVGNCRVLITHL